MSREEYNTYLVEDTVAFGTIQIEDQADFVVINFENSLHIQIVVNHVVGNPCVRAGDVPGVIEAICTRKRKINVHS